MKKSILAVGLFFFLGISMLQADSRIEGFWRSTETGLVIEIEHNRDGINVRQAESGNWRFYPEIFAADSYGDRFGDKFKLVERNELLWIEDGLIRDDRFRKVQNQDYDYWRDYESYDYLEQRNVANEVNNGYGLSGEWVTRSGRDVLVLQATRFGLEVRKNGSRRWRDYREVGRRKFRDRSGNSIKILDSDSLVWKSNCGRYKVIYEKAYRDNRGRYDYDRRRRSCN